MAFEFGQFSEWSDSVTFADPVVAATAKAIMLGPWVGSFYQSMGAPEMALTTKEFEIYSRSKTSRNGVIGEAWDDSAVSGLSLDANALKGLTLGHILRIDGEIVVISKVNREAGTIDVIARGYGGTTAKAHDAGTQFTCIGYTGSDTDLKNVESMNETTSVYSNYVQTVFEAIDWTKHGALVRKGMKDAAATATLLIEAETRVAEMLSTMAINGIKYRALGEKERYMSAGLIAQLTDDNEGKRNPLIYDVGASGGVLSEQMVKDAIKQVMDGGGAPNTIWCNPTNKTFVNNFISTNNALQVNTGKGDHTAGGQYVTKMDYEGHILDVKVDADIPSDTIAIVNMNYCKKGWLEDDGLKRNDEPPASTREYRKSITGSIGFIVEDVGREHILLKGILDGPRRLVHNTRTVE